MKVKICHQAFDVWAEMLSYQESFVNRNGKYGATSLFIGTMRDFNEGVNVRRMAIEHYPGMTEKQLYKVLAEAERQWAVMDALIVHRVGEINPDESIVLIAVWSAHRGDAFDACRYIIETLKSDVPFWKNEILDSGQKRWVEKNTNGYRNAHDSMS